MKLFLVTAIVVSTLTVYLAMRDDKHIYWLSASQADIALVAREETDSGLIVCVRVSMNDQEALDALRKLRMVNMENYSTNFAPDVANCVADWWDIEFPFQAKWFSRAGSGTAMQYATLKEGVFYHIHTVY